MITKTKVKKITPAVYGILIICFFMPFLEVSCSGEKIMTFTGIQMVTGTTMKEPSMFGEKTKSKKMEPEPLAIITFCCVIAALLFSFIKNRKSAILPAICSGIAIITLLILKLKIDNEVLKEGEGIIQIGYAYGFWIILVMLLFGAMLNGYVFSGKSQIENEDSIENLIILKEKLLKEKQRLVNLRSNSKSLKEKSSE